VPDFPTVNVTPIATLATNVVDATTDTSVPGSVFNNIRIAAGTNPVFASDVIINGAVYVEAPNIIKFAGQTTLNGVVVTEQSEQPLEKCQITFAGTVTANGVDDLPDIPEFALIKEHTGTFVAAPGFGVTFAGNFSAINGAVAADKLTFTGTAEGTIRGCVIGLEDHPTVIDGNVDIFVDRSGSDENPAGFIESLGVAVLPDTYTECIGN
jgi:hypothetical protein